MFAPKNYIPAKVDTKTYPLGENAEPLIGGPAMALVALSHTTIEHRVYLAMLTAADGNGGQSSRFTARRLLALTGIRSLSTVRRGLDGLVSKLSIEREPNNKKNGHRENGHAYRVYLPEEIIGRRKESGMRSAISGLESLERNHSVERALSRVLENHNLSRREAQVALCCVEGLTNAGIGHRLQVSEQTVKFHLRHVFIKFGVKRRAELISRLLM